MLFQKGNKAAAGHPWEKKRRNEKQAAKDKIRDAWATGHLAYKLAGRALLAKIRGKWMASRKRSRKFLINASRRTGKSSLGLLILTEQAIRQKADFLYVAPVKKHLANYIRPIYDDLFADCPAKFKAVFKENKAMLVFPNGSRIMFVGSNRDTYESSIRSFKLKMIFIDEAREIDDFKDMLESAALPSVFDSDGYLLISSTPAKALDHELRRVQTELEAIGAYHHNDVHEVGYPAERIAMFERETCGRNCKPGEQHSAAWQREYLALWVRDESILIIPEFRRNIHVSVPPKDRLCFPFYHKFECMDQGGVHKTVVLFCYFRFGKTPSFVVDAEEVFTGTDVRVDLIAARIKEREKKCGFNSVFRRVADVNDRIAIRSLNSMYSLDFSIVKKIYGENNVGDKGLKAMVNEARVWFKGDPASIAINPACVELIGALENCVWDDYDKFAMSRNYGHADAIAALMYGFLHVPDQNPFPPGWQVNNATQFNEETFLGKTEDKDMLALQASFGFLSDLQTRKY